MIDHTFTISLPEGISISSMIPEPHPELGTYICIVDKRGAYYAYGSGYGSDLQAATVAALAQLEREYTRMAERVKDAETYKQAKPVDDGTWPTLEDLGL